MNPKTLEEIIGVHEEEDAARYRRGTLGETTEAEEGFEGKFPLPAERQVWKLEFGEHLQVTDLNSKNFGHRMVATRDSLGVQKGQVFSCEGAWPPRRANLIDGPGAPWNSGYGDSRFDLLHLAALNTEAAPKRGGVPFVSPAEVWKTPAPNLMEGNEKELNLANGGIAKFTENVAWRVREATGFDLPPSLDQMARPGLWVYKFSPQYKPEVGEFDLVSTIQAKDVWAWPTLYFGLRHGTSITYIRDANPLVFDGPFALLDLEAVENSYVEIIVKAIREVHSKKN